MKHYGDITKIDGHAVPAVDVVIGGSPCQDLSVAGRREGLDGERSGLFLEQLRIVRELRNEDQKRAGSNNDIRPRIMVWENVPGALTSHNGEDFRKALEEIAHIVDENAVIPRPPRGKWTNAGVVVADGWSVAWRICDAQFFGVPQRRRRIALVADFGGQRAGEILFEREGVCGDSASVYATRKGTSEAVENGARIESGGGGAYQISRDHSPRENGAGVKAEAKGF